MSAATTTMQRLSAYVGTPYVPGAFDCADLAVRVQADVFGRTVTLPAHPGGAATQRAAVQRHTLDVATPLAQPADGAAVLLTSTGAAGLPVYHIGTVALHCGQAWVLHNSHHHGGARLERLQDLQRQGLRLEGFYAWN